MPPAKSIQRGQRRPKENERTVPGDGADGEEDGGDDGPALGHRAVEVLAGAEVEAFGGEEEDGQADADGSEVDVEAEGHAHEGSGGGYGIEHVLALRKGVTARRRGRRPCRSGCRLPPAGGGHISQYIISGKRQGQRRFD